MDGSHGGGVGEWRSDGCAIFTRTGDPHELMGGMGRFIGILTNLEVFE
ncbi:hypothetical protein [Streptomyces sp. NPDC001985]